MRCRSGSFSRSSSARAWWKNCATAGYAIERLHALHVPRWLAAAVPLLIFGVGHWTGGWANIVLALALGAVLAAFYLWKRDLLANMIGHFLVDFVPNVVTRLFS